MNEQAQMRDLKNRLFMVNVCLGVLDEYKDDPRSKQQRKKYEFEKANIQKAIATLEAPHDVIVGLKTAVMFPEVPK